MLTPPSQTSTLPVSKGVLHRDIFSYAKTQTLVLTEYKQAVSGTTCLSGNLFSTMHVFVLALTTAKQELLKFSNRI